MRTARSEAPRRDAEVVRPDESDVTGLVRLIVDFHRSGERIRGVRRGPAPTFVENQWELAVHGDTRVELVLTPEALEVVRTDPTCARQVCEMLDEETVRYFVAEEVPISVGLVDEVVGIYLTDEQGVLEGALFVDDETVRAWAVGLFEMWRERSRPVERDAVGARPPGERVRVCPLATTPSPPVDGGLPSPGDGAHRSAHPHEAPAF